jgi:periplasmic protein TonB
MSFNKVMCIIVLFASILLCQEDPYKPVAEEMPTPVGGYEAVYKKVVYPELARNSGIQGKVYLLVYINEAGGVDDVKTVKGIGAGCDQAAEEVIRKTKFNAGKSQGQAIKVKLTIPFVFKMK